MTTRLFGLALVCFSGFFANAAPGLDGAESPTSTGQVEVADIIVAGNRNISTDRIMSYITIRVGNQYSREQLKNLLLEDDRRLLETRMFRNVVPQTWDLPDGQINIFFKVQEYPNLIRDIVYKNANHISKKELEEMTRLRKGMPLDPAANERAAFAIQDYLKNQGRYFANVILEEGGDPSDQRVVFNITEGPVVRVTKIRYIGNHQVASPRLESQILPGLITARVSFLDMIDSDVLKLEEYYKANGFMDVRVTRELVFDDDFRSVTVVFHIDEGQKYRIEKVQVEGAHAFPLEEVTSMIQAKPGEYYVESVVNADVRNITDYYGGRARKAMVRKDLYFTKTGLVNVVYDVTEGPPAKVGNVIIVGNEITKDQVIRKAIPLYPGQPLRYPDLRTAERNLERLGIFLIDKEQGIRPTVTVLESDSEFKDILVQVQETPTGSLFIGAGFNSEGQIIVNMTVEERNFDPYRFPISLADIRDGRAFRGGGRKWRLDVFHLTLPGSLSLMRLHLDKPKIGRTGEANQNPH